MFVTVLTKDGNFHIYDISLERKFDISKDPHSYITKNQTKSLSEDEDKSEFEELEGDLEDIKPKSKKELMH